MNHTLIPASTAFIATIGQMPSSALNATSTRLATRFSTRNRSTRACSSE
jgi:hypothetical protein